MSSRSPTCRTRKRTQMAAMESAPATPCPNRPSPPADPLPLPHVRSISRPASRTGVRPLTVHSNRTHLCNEFHNKEIWGWRPHGSYRFAVSRGRADGVGRVGGVCGRRRLRWWRVTLARPLPCAALVLISSARITLRRTEPEMRERRGSWHEAGARRANASKPRLRAMRGPISLS